MHSIRTTIAGVPQIIEKPSSPVPSTDTDLVDAVPNTADERISTYGATATGSFNTTPRSDDPYCYQTGFGNRFSSEAVYVSELGKSYNKYAD